MDQRHTPPRPRILTGPAAAASVVAPGRRRLLFAASGLAIAPWLPSLAHAANVVAVRTWPATDYTRVTLEVDSALKAEHFLLDNPLRMVVDLEGLTLSSQLRNLVSKIEPDDPYVSNVRVGQFQPDVVRLVFDLKQNIAPQVFT